MRGTGNMVKVISEIQKISSSGFTSYKAGQKSDIKQLFNGHLTVSVNMTQL